MLPVPEASLEANEICSEIIHAGIQTTEQRCSFSHLQVWSYCWIVRDYFLTRSKGSSGWYLERLYRQELLHRLHDWADRNVTSLDIKGIVDDIQSVHCWRLYSWRRLIWISKIEFVVSTPWGIFRSDEPIYVCCELWCFPIFLWSLSLVFVWKVL